MSPLRPMSGCLAAVLLVGCGSGARLAEWAADNGEAASVESALLAAATENMDPTGTEADAATATAAAADIRFGDCVTATAAGPTVTYQLSGCTGPYGLLAVSGTVDVTYLVFPVAMGETDMAAAAVSTDLDIHGGVFDLDAGAAIDNSGGTRTLVVTTNSSGTTARGHRLTRTGTSTAVADDVAECVTLAGDWVTTVDGEGWDTVLSAYGKCGSACPAAGGSIALTGESGRSVTVAFDGTDTASWESDNGRTGTVELHCP